MIYKAPRIADYDSSTLTFGVSSEDFESHTTNEEGGHMIGTVIFLTATTEDGVVFIREVGIADWVVTGFDREFGVEILVRTADPVTLNQKAGFMLTKLDMTPSPRLNPNAWHFYRCVYGSKAYQDLGMERHLRDLEEMEARDEGYR